MSALPPQGSPSNESDQAWFWTEGHQAAERAADADVAAGRMTVVAGEDLLAFFATDDLVAQLETALDLLRAYFEGQVTPAVERAAAELLADRSDTAAESFALHRPAPRNDP